MIQKLLFTIGWSFILLTSCQKERSVPELDRPHDPWVVRSVLDGTPRVVTLALHKDLWVSYFTESGGLYKVWKGWVLFDGPVYTTKHGPQPVSVGDAFIVNKYKNPWVVKQNNQTVSFNYQYRGHKFNWPHVTLIHELQLENGAPIRMEEQVEFSEKESGQLGLERVFKTIDIPENIEIGLQINVSSIIIENHVETDGTWEIKSKNNIQIGKRTALELDGTLWLNKIDNTRFVCYFTDQPLIPNLSQAAETDKIDPNLPDGAILIAQNDCRTCHNDKVKTVGPAYEDVAKKYKNNEGTIDLLTKKIIEGGSGIWGTQQMNAHPNLGETKVRTMVEYILSLSSEAEKSIESNFDQNSLWPSQKNQAEEELIQGAYVTVYTIQENLKKVPSSQTLGKPIMAGVMPSFDNLSGNDFKELNENFAIYASGFIKIPKTKKYSFRVWSDDGSKFYLDDKEVIDHDGIHGTSFKETTLTLEKGLHSFRLEFFQGKGGKFLSLNWKPEGVNKWMVIPQEAYSHSQKKHLQTMTLSLPMAILTKIPGNHYPLESVHPSFNLTQARPDSFEPMVGGMDFLNDGRLAVSTWDSDGAVYLIEGVESGDPSNMSAKKIASGLAEPLGLKVVDNEIYVMQKQELTRLIDLDGDDLIDEYQTLCDDWMVSPNFHEFGFGLEYQDGYFYATLATAIEPGGASTQPQLKDRGKAIKISKTDGAIEFVAHGLRTPNGIGIGYNDEIFVADNQGDWLPSSKIVHVRPDAWFGSRSVDYKGTEGMQETLPLVWLPQDEIGNSPSTPSYLNVGPYKGQMIHGEVTHGGVKRVFVEEVNGNYQGAVFRFIQGLEAGVNRLCWGPDGALYIGGIGNPGNWGQTGKNWFGLQRLEYNGESVFEMLAIRAKSNGIEIEFTEPLQHGEGWDENSYLVKQWYYLPTIEYGGPKMDEKVINISSVNVSEDRKKVFLELEGMKPNHVVYIYLKNHFVSENNHSLWSTEAWYTMNEIPLGKDGIKSQRPIGTNKNQLTQAEKDAGWKLLFDGKNFNNWRGYKKDKVSDVWNIEDGAMTMDTVMFPNGKWGSEGSNDIISKDQFENFELSLEWKIQNCGNSGIFFLVQELEDYNAAYFSGPEMQILDNVCHPDSKYPTHRAGDLYDMIECKYVSVNPAGEWNKVRLIVNKGKAEHWLNGYKVVEYELWTEKWDEMITSSKFKDWPMAKTRKGHIALQDHDDKVWFRNIKIREL